MVPTPTGDEDESDLEENDGGDVPELAIVGLLVGIVPLAYLGFWGLGLIMGGVLGVAGFVAQEYPDKTRDVIGQVSSRIRGNDGGERDER